MYSYSDDEIKFCLKCSWNDSDFGCTCPSREEVYQCPMYMFYHSDEVEQFNKDMQNWVNQRQGH